MNGAVEKKLNRIEYFDFLRAIAIIAVVILHVACANLHAVEVGSFTWNVFSIINSAVRWSVPIFVMVSGALFLDPGKAISVKTLYAKYIFRLVISYIVWSAFYAVMDCVLYGVSYKQIIAAFIKGHYHLWFLIMMIGLYMAVPILRKITAAKPDTRYFLILSFIFAFVVPTAVLVLKEVSLLYGTGGIRYEICKSVFDNLNFAFPAEYVFYFILGYYLNTVNIGVKTELAAYISGIAGFAATFLLTYIFSGRANAFQGDFLENGTLNVLLGSVAVFVFAKRRAASIMRHQKPRKIIVMISKYSFGVYLVHAVFIEACEAINLTTLSFNPILSVFVISVITMTLSLAVSFALKKIPWANKFLS